LKAGKIGLRGERRRGEGRKEALNFNLQPHIPIARHPVCSSAGKFQVSAVTTKLEGKEEEEKEKKGKKKKVLIFLLSLFLVSR